jgi:hypothetical protein
MASRYIDELQRGNLVNVGGKRNRFVPQKIYFIEKLKTSTAEPVGVAYLRQRGTEQKMSTVTVTVKGERRGRFGGRR